jgi:pimeloyl-ACP methyl ester carboxylesterase
LILIGYRWPSEQTSPKSTEEQEAGGSLSDKLRAARAALPVVLGKISRGGIIGLIGGVSGLVASILAISWQSAQAITFLIVFSALTILSLIAIAPILTILVFRLIGYFRDNYRANNFGVADLVELIRQIDNSLIKDSPGVHRSDQETYWDHDRIKLSFIGHSMGAFVVTNTVRILSDVFDSSSIGSIDANNPNKNPSSSIGNVFSLGRLVLVAPDVPAETIISGRANFLQSSLRRFEEAYLFSNEGDMALRLASTAANYFTYPTKTQDGGYRLGNVAIRTSQHPDNIHKSESYGLIARRADGQMVRLQDGQEFPLPGYPLDYLYIREQTPLSQRQQAIALAPEQQPIGELFTFFDCTDYIEQYCDRQGQQTAVGMVSQARRKPALSFGDYVSLSIDYFSGKIDTHGGYFSDEMWNYHQNSKPAAAFTKLAIYGLASLGLEKFLLELPTTSSFIDYQSSFNRILADLQFKHPELTPGQQEKMAFSHILSSICRDQGIQVLLAQERYTVDILKR